MPECLTIQFKLPRELRCGSGKTGRTIIGMMIQEARSEGDAGMAMLPLVHRTRLPDGRLTTVGGMSAFRVFENEHSFYLRALGDQASQYLAMNIHHVAGWISRKVGSTVPMSWNGGIVGLTEARSPQQYFVNGLVLARAVKTTKDQPRATQARRHQELFEASCENVPERVDLGYVAEKIQRGLEAQCDVIGVDVPEDGLLVEVLAIPRLKLVEGVPGQYWPAANVLFSVNARLIGPWNIGPGASKGFGMIGGVRTQAALAAA